MADDRCNHIMWDDGEDLIRCGAVEDDEYMHDPLSRAGVWAHPFDSVPMLDGEIPVYQEVR